MTPIQIAFSIGLSIIVINFAASALGHKIPLLNKLVTVVLSIFVTFEIFKLGQALLIAFG